MINKQDVLNVVLSFINDLRPESTGLICDIYDAILKMDEEKEYGCVSCSMARCINESHPCNRKRSLEKDGTYN